jgi:drug/metabolite transporter (DMT)-like permease
MKPAGIVGIILIVIGVIALAYQGISYTTHERERVVELGPLKVDATVQREHTLPLPPILGVVALAGGVVLLVTSSRKGTT